MMTPRQAITGLTTDWLPHTVAALVFLVCVVLILGSYHNAREERRRMALEAVETFEVSIAALHKYYSKEIVPRAQVAGAEFAHDYREHDDRIPFPGTIAMDFGEELRAITPGLDTNLYSTMPFPWRKDRELDTFERESLAYLQVNPEQAYIRFEVGDGSETVRLARAVVMKDDCVACHNLKEFGFERIWQTGDVRGARQVSIPLTKWASRQLPALIWASLIALLAAAIGAALVLPALRSLELANQAKSRLLAGVSHDLRTPLNAIIGFSEVLQAKHLGDREDTSARDYASYIRASGTHLLGMINQLMDIGQIESGSWPYDEREIRVSSLIGTLEPLLRMTVEKSGMRFELEPPHEDLVFRGDETAMREILINLVDNAVKYSQGSRVMIVFDRTERGLSITVEDDGVGVDAADLKSLKRLHYRGVNSRGGDVAGLGIGLWLVDWLASLHESKIEVESRPDHGSRFTMTIPPARLVSLDEEYRGGQTQSTATRAT